MVNKKSKALSLRRQGYSYALIHEKTGVPLSTMSYWFRNMQFTPNAQVRERMQNGSKRAGLVRRRQRMADTAAQMGRGITDIGTLTERDLWMLGLGLYIGEGAKTTEQVRVANSDPEVIRLVMAWLRGLGVPDKNINLAIHIYPDTSPELSKDFWLKTTGLSESNFGWVSIDKRENKSRKAAGKLPYGTAHIILRARGEQKYGVQFFRRLKGWMQGVYNQV